MPFRGFAVAVTFRRERADPDLASAGSDGREHSNAIAQREYAAPRLRPRCQAACSGVRSGLVLFCSSLWLPVRAAHRDSLFAESSLHGPLVGVHAFGDVGCGPALLVELCSLIDLVGLQASSAHGHVVSS